MSDPRKSVGQRKTGRDVGKQLSRKARRPAEMDRKLECRQIAGG